MISELSTVEHALDDMASDEKQIKGARMVRGVLTMGIRNTGSQESGHVSSTEIQWAEVSPRRVLIGHGSLVKELDKLAAHKRLAVASICGTAASILRQVTSVGGGEIDAKLIRKGSVGRVATDLRSFSELSFKAYVKDQTGKSTFKEVTVVIPDMCFLRFPQYLKEVR